MSESKLPKTAPTEMNIYQKILEVRKSITHLTKDATSHHHKYVSGSALLAAIRPKMDELGILVLTKVINRSRDNLVIDMDISYEIINVDNPEDKIIIPWYATGKQNDPSQSFGSATTYSERYFWGKLLLIPTDEDDPDALPPKTSDKPRDKSQTERKPSQKADASLLEKIGALCMYMAEGNKDRANECYHDFADFDGKDGKVKAPVLDKLPAKWAGNVYAKLKKQFEELGLDITAALYEYGPGGDNNG